MSLTRKLALAAAALLSTGCSEDPSFEVNWRIASDIGQLADATEPGSIAECTALGIGGVRIETILEGVTVDSRDRDCYAGGAVAGPELSPGEYIVTVAGLRRNGSEWECIVPSNTPNNASCEGDLNCECTNDLDCDAGLSCAIIEGSNEFAEGDGDGDDDAEAPFIRVCSPCSARHTQTVTVTEGNTSEVEATLIAPPECDDGIDNDLDGLTDLLDPACAKDPTASEDSDASDTVVNLRTTFLNDSPTANCDVEAADAFPLDVVAFQVEVTQGSNLVDSRVLTCQRNLSIYTLSLPEGDYTLSLTGYGVSPEDDPEAEARTVTKSVEFGVAGSDGAFVGESFDFDGADFLPQINGSLGFSALFEIGGGVDMAGINRGCLAIGNNNSSPLNIDQLALRVLDADDNPVDLAGDLGLALNGSQDEEGFGLITCPADGSQSVITDAIDWGSYRIEVQGRVGENTCFAETLYPLPGSQLTTPIDRVFVDGLPPAGCEDCSVDSDCPPFFGNCVDGLCLSN